MHFHSHFTNLYMTEFRLYAWIRLKTKRNALLHIVFNWNYALTCYFFSFYFFFFFAFVKYTQSHKVVLDSIWKFLRVHNSSLMRFHLLGQAMWQMEKSSFTLDVDETQSPHSDWSSYGCNVMLRLDIISSPSSYWLQVMMKIITITYVRASRALVLANCCCSSQQDEN